MLLKDIVKKFHLNQFQVKNFLNEQYPSLLKQHPDMAVGADFVVKCALCERFGIDMQGLEKYHNAPFQDYSHEKFEILEHRGNYTLVTHPSFPTERFTTVPLQAEPGESVILYVNGRMLNGNLKLDYSILNDYAAGKEATFSKVGKTANGNGILIRGQNILQHYIPTHLEDRFINDEITLEVRELDLEKNRLNFLFDTSFKNSKELEIGETYLFAINKLIINPAGVGFLELELDGGIYKSLATRIHMAYGIPKAMYLKVVDKDEFGYKFSYDFERFLKEKFEVNQAYTFTIKDIATDVNGFFYFILEDEYGNFHRYYDVFSNLEEPQRVIGESINLYLRSINNKGHLELISEVNEQDKIFYHPDEFFKINGIDEEKYLHGLNYVKLKPEVGMDENFHPFTHMLEQMKDQNNNWIFSYLNLISLKISILLQDQRLDDAAEHIKIYMKAEKWLTESKILTTYTLSKRQQVYDSALNQIRKSEFILRSIKEIKDGTAYSNIENLHTKLENIGIISTDEVEQFGTYLQMIGEVDAPLKKKIKEILGHIIELDKINVSQLHVLESYLEKQYHIEPINILEELILSPKAYTKALPSDEDLEMLFLHFKLLYVVEKDTMVYKFLDLFKITMLKSENSEFSLSAFARAVGFVMGSMKIKFTSAPKFLKDILRYPLPQPTLSLGSICTGNTLYLKKGAILENNQRYLLTTRANYEDNQSYINNLAIVKTYFEGMLSVCVDAESEYHYKGLEDESNIFWYKYFFNNPNNKLADKQFPDPNSIQYKRILSLINVLDVAIYTEKDFGKKLDYINLAKLITSIIKNAKSFFYSELSFFFDYLKKMQNFPRPRFKSSVQEVTLKNFPQLYRYNQVYAFLSDIFQTNPVLPIIRNEEYEVDMKNLPRLGSAYSYAASQKSESGYDKELLKMIQHQIADEILGVKNFIPDEFNPIKNQGYVPSEVDEE